MHTKEVICVHVDKGRKHDYRLFKESKLPISKYILKCKLIVVIRDSKKA
jgi:hypothetical protein